jgi:ferritin-like metal-binding protein YciE
MSEATYRQRPGEIERDLEGKRAELAETWTTLEGRFSQGELLDQAVYLLREHGPELGRRLGDTISRNPLPAVLIGVGVVWLALATNRPRHDEQDIGVRRHPRSFTRRGATMTASKETLAAWLRDAHAMEHQAIEILEKQTGRLEHYPELRAKVREHLEQSHRQAERVEQCLELLGTDTSSIKTGLGKMTGTVQQLSGLFASDEVMKASIADYAFEHYEIACYRVLSAAASEAGAPEVARICEQNLREEEAMADWLAQRLPEVTRQYLQREATGQEAKR